MTPDSSGAPGVLFLLGANHHSTPLELREKLALTAEKMAAFRAQLQQLGGLREHVVLNTCNRIEFYGLAEDPAVIERLQAAFCAFQGVPATDFDRIKMQSIGLPALQHLLEVSSGLNSQMVGETEILGQVKAAYAEAQTRQTVGRTLNRAFQKTFQYAKLVRSVTAITEGQVSVANVAVELAQKIFGELSRTRILLLGAGEIGEKTAKAFQSRGAQSLTVASRRLERAMELAEAFRAVALPFDQFAERLADFDIVVCSTAAPHAVVTTQHASQAIRKRKNRPLFFIDMALPRDVEPNVAEQDNVFLYNLDDLAKIADENRAAREIEVKRARQILEEKAAALWKQLGVDIDTKVSRPNDGLSDGALSSSH